MPGENELHVRSVRATRLRSPYQQTLLPKASEADMTWETNTITFVRCDDAQHGDDPVIKLETGFDITAGKALAVKGWSYNHEHKIHRCPKCTQRFRRRN